MLRTMKLKRRMLRLQIAASMVWVVQSKPFELSDYP
jgi:hypothetical protein